MTYFVCGPCPGTEDFTIVKNRTPYEFLHKDGKFYQACRGQTPCITSHRTEFVAKTKREAIGRLKLAVKGLKRLPDTDMAGTVCYPFSK